MNDAWKEIDRYLEHRGLRVGQPTLGRTMGGRHASSPGHYSFHYEGLARDYSVFDSDASMIARKLEFIASDPNGPIAELRSTRHLVQRRATPQIGRNAGPRKIAFHTRCRRPSGPLPCRFETISSIVLEPFY
jgi:hypothetical protein